jgi:signal transduction histidine kinase
MSIAITRPVTRTVILQVMLAGFTLVILLLVVAGFIGVRNLGSIQSAAAQLLQEQSRTSDLLDEVLRQQRAINTIYSSFTRPPDLLDREDTLDQLEASDKDIERIAKAAAGQPGQGMWRDLFEAASVFSKEARRLLEDTSSTPSASNELLESHQRVVALVDRLVDASTTRSVALNRELEDSSSRLLQQSAYLLGAGFLLSLGIVLFTVRLTMRLIRQLEWQTGELSRVSWQLLENQETTARRFSHELHDELGQSLTAVKANLVALADHTNGARDRLTDCLRLVDDSIANVREMSQLLRPTILDDFGLSAGLKWLCDGFHQRTGITVEFHSDFQGRLKDETETHLFRIAQEALTNVARHSNAQKVQVTLSRQGGDIDLRIKDDGRGFELPQPAGKSGLGMVGMRARARGAGGEVRVLTTVGQGVQVQATFPFQERAE